MSHCSPFVPTAIQGLIGNSGGFVTPSTAGTVHFIGSSGATVVGDPATHTLTISASSTGLTWNNNAISGPLSSNNGYIITAGAQSFSLPVASAIGDEIILMLNGGTSWTITMAGTQRIRVGDQLSSLGGTVATVFSNLGNTISLICTSVNSTWEALSFVGLLDVN
ncbi:MAG: hypothetical protein LLG04_04140 [Parachlamydia sp.]|nr:hypothetical protein [Parachlamydia sp.]